MILVDSSVWIDQFADRETIQTRRLNELLAGQQIVGIGDLIMTEVLQGTRSDRAFHVVLERLSAFPRVRIAGFPVAEQAARNYRHLRAAGITIRKTIDTLIATRCILGGMPLLYNDRDYDPFVQHLNLRSALHHTGVT